MSECENDQTRGCGAPKDVPTVFELHIFKCYGGVCFSAPSGRKLHLVKVWVCWGFFSALAFENSPCHGQCLSLCLRELEIPEYS